MYKVQRHEGSSAGKEDDILECMQGTDIRKAVHWLNVAGKNNLMHLAAKAERFLIQAATRLSGSPEAVHIQPSTLLRMLDSRHAAIMRMQATAKGLADQFKTVDACITNNQLAKGFGECLKRLYALEPAYPSFQ